MTLSLWIRARQASEPAAQLPPMLRGSNVSFVNFPVSTAIQKMITHPVFLSVCPSLTLQFTVHQFYLILSFCTCKPCIYFFLHSLQSHHVKLSCNILNAQYLCQLFFYILYYNISNHIANHNNIIILYRLKPKGRQQLGPDTPAQGHPETPLAKVFRNA